MFSELPKLLGRDFAVGYFLPFVAFLAANVGLADAFGIHPTWLRNWGQNIILDATVAGLISWIGGTLLVALNRSIIRLFEGYGAWNPFRLKKRFQEKAFDNLKKQIKALDDQYRQYDEKQEAFPNELEIQYEDLQRRMAEGFPDTEDAKDVLPTAFGNTIAAFESYPRVVYGLDGVVGWSRLIAVIPKDYEAKVDALKAQVDFWVSLWLLAIVFLVEYVSILLYSRIALHNWHFETLWIPFLGVFVLLAAVNISRQAALEWGDSIKAAFDVFLPKLETVMGYSPRATQESERALWLSLAQTMLYRVPWSLPERTATPISPLQPIGDNADDVQDGEHSDGEDDDF